jgi:DNA-directed RNA polymerase specialized sigma24 family protein
METERVRMHTPNKSRLPQPVPLEIGSNRCAFDSQVMPTLGTDNDLVLAAQSGDHEAFAELCWRHAQSARQRILGIVRHREDAEDALQETLLSAYANIGRFRQSSKFSTWITAIGTNAALSVLRKRKSRRELDIEPSNPEDPA